MAARTRALAWRTLGTVLVLLVAVLGAGPAIARVAARPILLLSDAVRTLDVEHGALELPRNLGPEADFLGSALEEALAGVRAHARALAASNRELQQFAYIASHDLQEPLRTISSYVALLQSRGRSMDEATWNTCVGFIVESCERARGQIHALLDYSRIGQKSRATRCDLNAVVEHVLADLGAAIEESGARIQVSPLPSLVGYEPELRLLFQNLISNGIKYCRVGEPPCIEICAEPAGSQWKLCVSDWGIGIPADKREQVFHMFQRLHNRDEREGTGIGLAHCMKIVEMHGGRIWIEDGPNGETCVCFWIAEVAESE